MNIAFAVRDLEPGGAEQQLLTLAAGLQARGHAVLVIVLRGGGRLEPAFAARGVAVRALSISRWWVPALAVRLPRLLRAVRPDVIHGYLPLGNCIAVAAALFHPGTKRVMGIRGVSPERQAGGWRVRAFYGLEAFCARFATAVIANSEQARAEVIRRGFPAGRVHVVHNGIDIERFVPDTELRSKMRSSWSVSDSQVVVARVGGLRPIKDHPTFLRAAARVTAARAGFTYVCIGEGTMAMRAQLEALGAALGLAPHVVWTGHLDDMPAAMSAVDILVSSSSAESFPNVVAEAMACGVPCVVTDAGESATIVGETGAVVPVGAEAAMASAILALADRLADEGEALRQAARRRVESRFSVDTMVAATEQLLLTAIARSAAGRA